MSTNVLRSPFSLLSRKIKHSIFDSANEITQQIKYLFQWFTLGLSIKRWLIVNFVGIFLISWGFNNLTELLIVDDPTTAIAQLLNATTDFGTSYTKIAIAIALGIGLSCWGQMSFVSSITQPLQSANSPALIEKILASHLLDRGSKIVAVGGGTGLSNLLRGLKHHSNNLTAVVTVADDGGSSGRLREELGVLPPGDIRNCLTALTQEESLLSKLFDYRFGAGEGLKGHSFGNLFLTAMSEVTGNLETAIAASSKILGVQGQVLPATLNNVSLWAELDRGQIVTGESKIVATEGKIHKIGCFPTHPQAVPAVIRAIESADCIVLGPGSLYTSIIPNLLVPEIREAIAKAKVPRIYVCNIMTQPGETDGYTVVDHIQAIDRACGQPLFDAILVNSRVPSPEAIYKYAQEGSHPVILDQERVSAMNRQVILADVLDENFQTRYIRHHAPKLAQVLADVANENLGSC